MKVVHNRAREESSFQHARELELEGKHLEAAAVYEQLIKERPHDETGYRRLMIIYRKQKDLKKELAVINKGLKAFETLYAGSSKLQKDKKILALSRALLRSTGLSDRKGKPLYQKEPLGSWTRRKMIVEKKLKRN